MALDKFKQERPYFDVTRMKPVTVEYVCWFDVMGSNSNMLRSMSIAANFVMKLHIAALRAKREITDPELELYPMIDGIYACTPQQARILAFANRLFSCVALAFIFEENPLYRFTVRAGLSFGPICKGRGAIECSPDLKQHRDYCDRILLGMPLSQAYDSEKRAAPFGLYLHESTRAFAPEGSDVLSGTHWKWWKFYNKKGDPQIATELRKKLKPHYEWCRNHVTTLLYEQDSINKHEALANEYFSDEE